MTNDPGPMIRRRQLGSALRRYREQSGLSAKDVAERLLSSPTKISRLETAQRNATLRDVRDLCDIYGIEDEGVRQELMDLARSSRERGWWQGAGLSPAIESLIGMEGAASTINEFELAVVPGLLQTRDYATVMANLYGPENVDEREMSVNLRLRRQEIFKNESPPVFNVVLDESVLRRVIGSEAIMHDQLVHLRAMAAKKVINLRVLPFDAGEHLGMLSGFTVLEFPQSAALDRGSAMSAVVYTETYMADSFWISPPWSDVTC